MIEVEKERVAMFRYGVIAPVVCRRLENKGAEWALRKEILMQDHVHPDGSLRKIPERTLRYWISNYRKYGLDGLYDGFRKPRKNKGRYRAIPAEMLERAEVLRREVPQRSAAVILDILKAQGHDVDSFSERSLQRHLSRLGAQKGKSERGKELHKRWEQLYVNDLWHGDTAHAVWLPDPTNPNKMRRTKLIAFVDDASRICTHGEFYFDEKLPNLVDTLSKAMLKRGKPRRLLLDNAFIFHSTTLELMAAELQIELAFCRPRAPQGKGKIERLIRTIKEDFVSEANAAGFTNLSDLNRAFQGWLATRYHSRVHSELGLSPEERWSKDTDKLVPVTPEHIRRSLMLRANRQVQPQTGILRLDGLEYQCSREVAGRTVEVRWHVDVADFVEVWDENRCVEIAKLDERLTSVPRRAVVEEQYYPTLSSSKVRMETLRRVTGEEPVGPMCDEILTCEQLVKLIGRYLERALSQRELDNIGKFFMRLVPLARNTVEAELRKAIGVKGAALHLRYYLEHIEKAILAGRSRK